MKTSFIPSELEKQTGAVAIGRRNANLAIEIGKNMHFTNSRNQTCVCNLDDCTGVSEDIDAEGQRTHTADEIMEF